MTVEEARTADIGELTGLRLEYISEDSGPLSPEETAAFRSALPGYFRAHLGDDLFAFVVREDDMITSCALLLVAEKPMSPKFPNGKTGTVLNVYTRPAYRKRGYASEVMKALLKKADGLELSVVELKATDSGYPLYRSLGFSDDNSKYRPMKRIHNIK